jgi:hypothetical protein
MAVLLLVCLLWPVAPLLAQSSYAAPAPLAPSVYAPEIHLGSASEPTTYIVPPVRVEDLSANPPQPVSNVPPASTELLATRHFDFITSPLDQVTPGSMEDTSISLGEYARQLRAEKQRSPSNTVPDAIASPNWR